MSARTSIFREYAYFSSYSTSGSSTRGSYCEMITERLGLGRRQPRRRTRQQRRLSPAAFPAARRARCSASSRPRTSRRSPSRRACRRGSSSSACKLADQLVAEGLKADLIAGNNVLAQVPDLNDFVAGIARLLKPEGVVTLEFPHSASLIAENQFDTIYHEHFSYFSLITIEHLAARHGLKADRRRGAGDPRRLAARLSRPWPPRSAIATGASTL